MAGSIYLSGEGIATARDLMLPTRLLGRPRGGGRPWSGHGLAPVNRPRAAGAQVTPFPARSGAARGRRLAPGLLAFGGPLAGRKRPRAANARARLCRQGDGSHSPPWRQFGESPLLLPGLGKVGGPRHLWTSPRPSLAPPTFCASPSAGVGQGRWSPDRVRCSDWRLRVPCRGLGAATRALHDYRSHSNPGALTPSRWCR